MGQPYENLSRQQSAINILKSQSESRHSVGILPNLGSNAPLENQSLMAYGSGAGSVAVDSSLVRLKAQRNNSRLQAEQVRPRYKSSLGYQFKDEVVSPVKQSKHLNLNPSRSIDEKAHL